MAWVGLERYGYLEEAQRLAYRWIYMYAFPPLAVVALLMLILCRMTTAFVDFNGVVPEKVLAPYLLPLWHILTMLFAVRRCEAVPFG